jgi:2-dehydro-3-deoxygluconokinase
MTVHDAVCVGESMVLLTPDPPGPLGSSERLRMDAAGAESNVAAYLAMQGHRAAWVSRVGDDPLGRLVSNRIRRHGVDVERVGVVPEAPTGVFFKDPGRDGSTVYYYRAGSAASRMDRTLWAVVPPARVIHLSGITPALSLACADLVEAGLATRPVAGATWSFDVNHRAGLWPAADAAPVLARLAALADVVFVGLDEAQRLWGCVTPDDVRVLLPTPSALVVKDGGVGATAYGLTGAVFVPAMPVDVVEPVGAGDAFAAGYLSGLLDGLPERDRLRRGHEVAGNALSSVADVASLRTHRELT